MYVFIIIIIILFLIFYNLINTEVKYVESKIDNKEYLVRDLDNSTQAAALLSNLKIRMEKITNYLYKNRNSLFKENKEYIENLYDRVSSGVKISENSSEVNYTSYSVNKGEELVFCLRSRNKDTKNKFHKLNLLTYVLLHEMAHIACPEYGHTPLYNSIFAFIVTQSINIGEYTKIDFYQNNTEYCGMQITSSIV
tara:strand:- start:110 stop:694 length:585 start_codon:yes stop_codon:yes gene_type:complete